MTWGTPQAWIGVVIVCGLALWSWTHQRVSLESKIGPRLMTLGGDGTFSKRGLWFWVGMILVSIALTRPQWGVQEEQVVEQSREVLIALDLSRSMLADDVSPTRLDRSKLLIQDLLDSLQGERVGLVLFAGTAFLQSPLSTDYEILRDLLTHLNPDYLPQAGTDYRRLLQQAVQAFGEDDQSGDRFLIILSDGESTVDGWESEASRLVERGVRVIGLGVGTAAGSVIPEKGGGLIKDEKGAVVLSSLNSKTLEALAEKTHGVYRDASQWVDLSKLIQDTIDTAKKGKTSEQREVRRVERYQWFLIPGILALLISLWREFPAQVSRRRADLVMQELKKMALLGLLFLGSASVLQAQQPPPPSPLVETVKVLSSRHQVSAGEWGTLAEQTIQAGQGGGGSLPKGSIYDGLEAVDRGEKADPKAADWPQLRKALEALLQEKQKSDSQNQDQKDSKDSKDSKDQKNDSKSKNEGKDSKGSESQDPSQNPPPSSQPQQKDQEKNTSQNQTQTPEQKKQEQKNAENRREDSKQKVGGSQPKGEGERVDVSKAEAMRLMRDIKEGDDPAKLFQILQGNPEPESTKGKRW